VFWLVRATGQSIRVTVVRTLLVDDLVLKLNTKEFGENALLPISVQTLVRQVN
jgi:hypothetical protein